jgi:GTP-binding protein HflX
MPRIPIDLTEQNQKERAVLVGVDLASDGQISVEESMDELVLLADTAGADIVDRMIQSRSRINAATYVGLGFAEKIGRLVSAVNADLVIFDEDLGPAQIRNLEKTIPAKIVDRSGLILDIFAERAMTREAKTQVELAQLEYLLPRLTRAWTHLSRQVGGIGTRGPGETQLEVDRRLVRKRIAELHKELDRIERQRSTQRQGREEFFQATLVGYTNAGKSTLLNTLADADVFVEDRLFATLDATTRSVELPGGPAVLITDTVGFIRKLPPGLVASFRSTLEEAVVADLLIHVVDVSHMHFEDHITSANKVLEDLDILEHQTLMVFNKIDCAENGVIDRVKRAYPDSIAVSALSGEGIEDLVSALAATVRGQHVTARLTIPQARADIVNRVYEMGAVLERNYDEESVELVVRTTSARAGRLNSLLGEVDGAHMTFDGDEDQQ